MKKIVLTGVAGLFALIASAQLFRKGEIVEINKNLSNEVSWLSGKIIEVNSGKKEYTVRGVDSKRYNIAFAKEETWMRRPIQALSASDITTDACVPSIDIVKQKIRDEFESDFSEYDSVTITYNAIEPQKSYRNTDAGFGKTDSDVYPFKVDITVRLVSSNKDGVQRKINWQFKRKYLLFQGKAGSCELTMAEREENLLSNI
jgi:hypothetical protein